MIDISNLTSLITAFRQETEQGSISPETLGALLQAIANQLQSATTDQELCRQAQEMAINEITPLYEALDEATIHLMNINIEKEHEMEVVCEALEIGAIILMVVLVISAAIVSKRIAHIISLPIVYLRRNLIVQYMQPPSRFVHGGA